MKSFMEYALEMSDSMRARRFVRFEEQVASLSPPLRILDVGGRAQFWERNGWADRDDISITCLNFAHQLKGHSNIELVEGDATDLSRYENDAFDVIFSNTVIEHLFSFEQKKAMADEMVRVGRAYWCQTPNFWFPIEPHFQFIGWQWLPSAVRVEILRRRRCGFRVKTPDREEARARVNEVRLMTKRELGRLFPDGKFYAEKIAGLVKSWTVYGGFSEAVG